jgi:hypothetical protein
MLVDCSSRIDFPVASGLLASSVTASTWHLNAYVTELKSPTRSSLKALAPSVKLLFQAKSILSGLLRL